MKTKNRKYNIDDNYFNKIDTEKKAYILGLMYADGCVYNDCKTGKWAKLDLKYDDTDLLVEIAKEMKNECPIKRHTYDRQQYFSHQNKTYQFIHDMCRLSMRSNQIVDDLIRLGCPPAKTFKIKFPSPEIVPNDLIKHFIRGYLDGDGSISYSSREINSKYRSTYLHFSITFTGTSEFVNSIKSYLNTYVVKFVGDIRSRWDNGKDNFTLSIDGNNIIEKILDWMYKDSTIYLKRKYDHYLLLKNELSEKKKSIEFSNNNRNPIRNEPFNIYKDGEYIGTCNNRRKFERESELVVGKHIPRLTFTKCLHKELLNYNGFSFVFVSEDHKIDNPIFICSGKDVTSKGRKVDQYDLDGNYLKTYDTREELRTKLNITKNQISQILSCCKHNQKTAFGFIWKYHDE